MSINAATKLYAVVGDPVAHSLSPLIHNRWIASAGIDASYAALQLRTEDAASDLRALARAGFSGLNITLPHKAAGLRAADAASPEAQRIGAANTLAREPDGKWRAYNTDTDGFSLALDHIMGNGQNGRRIVLIGAGGAARAAVFVLVGRGAKLAIVNRSKANADILAAELGEGPAGKAETWGMDQLGSLAEDAEAVINTASLGHSGEALPSLPPGRGRPFFDMSYGRAAAGALGAASSAGWAAEDGLRMLVGQAASAFRIWHGVLPDIDGALRACRTELAARG